MNYQGDAGEGVSTVDAFSQLPFVRRRAPATRERNSGAIRLFGVEFPRYEAQQREGSSASSSSKETNEDARVGVERGNGKCDDDGGGGQESSNRKFECHYCCRNFSTSQALGGHQNAHKRERQQAKRAHLQSAVAAHYRHQGGIAHDGLFGFLNYQKSLPARFSFGGHYPGDIPSVAPYPTPRFYGDTPAPMPHPINGSPVPGPWGSAHVGHNGCGGVGPVRYPNSVALPLLGDGRRIVGGGSTCSSSSSPSSSSSYLPMLPSQNRLVLESKPAGVQEHVCLDLHL